MCADYGSVRRRNRYSPELISILEQEGYAQRVVVVVVVVVVRVVMGVDIGHGREVRGWCVRTMEY